MQDNRLSKRILEAIREIDPKYVESYPEAGKYVIYIDKSSAEVTIGTGKGWLGIELDVQVPTSNGPSTVIYEVDTDNYPLDEPVFERGNEEVVKSIISVIQAIKNNKIVVGNYKGRAAMVVPDNGEYILVRLLRPFLFLKAMQAQRSYKSYDELLKHSHFVPLTTTR